jgi:hypothetical protein
MLTPRELNIHWLDDQAVKAFGIDYVSIDNQASPQQPSNQPAPAPKYAYYEVTMNVHLRAEPAPSAREVLGPPPNNFIPQGWRVYGLVSESCQVWYGSRRDEHLWCPVYFGKIKGWANALYLKRTDGRLQACVDRWREGCPR